MKGFKFLVMLAAVMLVAIPLAMAQTSSTDGLGEFPVAAQSKNIPSGTVNEPGSQLLFVLESGIDANARFSDDPDFASSSVSDLDDTIEGAEFQNFIAITNTNPTRSITVHFRYFNADCSDIIDFLVILTCNDTMLIDPFNFSIPAAGVNVSQAFFGSASAAGVPGITAERFGDGRFLLFITASGDPVNTGDGIADYLFPRELVIDKFGQVDGAFPDCADADLDLAAGGNIGDDTGIGDDNLHILNASAVNFNYLVGFQTVAIPTDALIGELPEGANDLAYGISAFVRPAVDLTTDVTGVNEGFWGNNSTDPPLSGPGDGPNDLPLYTVLSGSENIEVNSVGGGGGTIINDFYLRSAVHGGEVFNLSTADPTPDFDSDTENEVRGALVLGGALAWTLFPIEGEVTGALPSEQFINFVSIVDDYNGTGNPVGGVADESYGLESADTIYTLTVFNNDEVRLTAADSIISPPPPGEALEILIRCITAWTFTGDPVDFDADGDPIYDSPASGGYTPVSRLGNFSVSDLFTVGGDTVRNFLATPVDVNDESGPGWIRFDRVVTGIPSGVVAGVGAGAVPSTTQAWDGTEKPSFATFGVQVVRFEGFGAGWYVPTSATDINQDDIN